MNINILNGNPQPSSFDSYLFDLCEELKNRGNQVELLNLRELGLKYCTGCFDCWTKTPGLCQRDLASQGMDRVVINSDFTLWATPLKMGFPSALLKTAFDKHLPLIHPYLVVDQGEAHHLKRYPKYPRVGLLVEKETDTIPEDINILRDIFARTALNLKTRLEFLETTELDSGVIANLIIEPRRGKHFYQKNLKPIPGQVIRPPQSLTLFNGSPRGKKGNTPIMLEQFQQGFGGETDLHHLVYLKNRDEQIKAFKAAECVWIGFPLYTDCMPGLVMDFIEDLESLNGTGNNPPLGFLVQSGFPEALHSRYVERYLANLAEKLGSPYLGTIVKGGGEGTRLRPAEANQNLFENLQALGQGIHESGRLDPDILQSLAQPEKFPRILGPVYRVFLKTKMAHRYFDGMLDQNNAYDRRNDQPFIEV
jgi:multimeric flavodoxin WrbA